LNTITLGVDGMSLEELIAIARQHAKVKASQESERRITATRRLIDEWVQQGRVIYGVTTGFGAMSSVTISEAQTRKLQNNILVSHSAGVGDLLDEESVRAIMALRIKDMARGHSGIRFETFRHLIELLNAGVLPCVPEKGSVGASGDLVPLAHLALVLIGKGEAFYQGRRLSGQEALAAVGLLPIRLESAEGLALVNGTQVMTGIGALAVFDAQQLCKYTDIAASMSLEVLMGSRTEFNARIQRVRPHPGQAAAADNMLRITQNSEIISSHKDCSRVQDAYTLRCSPQVHGASHDAIQYARRVVETEMNASTNNPLFFHAEKDFLLGGNFHGQPVGLAMDFLGIAAAELANISERRIERLVNPMLSGLPAFLISEGGLNSGFMLAQYTAAALVSENKVLAHPASVDSIPTSANKEDHVSMGTIAARKCRQIVENAENVLAIELLCAAQALDLFTNLKPGEGTLRAYQTIRKIVTHMDSDRVLAKDIAAVKDMMKSGVLLQAVEEVTGPLN
jgi:histidine ammonia-lyase